MNINILLCDTFPGLLPANIPSHASMFFNMFDSINTNINYKIFNVFDGQLPNKVANNELYIITGSRAGAYEDIPWVKELLSFIRQVHKKQTPLIGICFGHQAIAQALGGLVRKSEKGWGTGARQSEIVHPDALKHFPSGSMCLFYNHHDQVVQLPPEAELYATSSFCVNDGFVVGKHILTFQGHPEYTADYNKYVIQNHAQDESEAVKFNALKSIDNMQAINNKEVAEWILDIISE